MQVKVFDQAPPVIVVLAVFSLLFVLLSRESFVKEGSPAFLSFNRDFSYIELTGNAVPPGVYQFNDGLALRDVIKLTAPDYQINLSKTSQWDRPLLEGERIKIVKKGREISLLQRSWMPASHRVSMGILLHPDRMSFDDWQYLPRIGKTLAAKIEKNRQENGDYVVLDGLLRVKGIGEKSVSKWREFFSGE